MATQDNVVTATEKTVDDIRANALSSIAEQFADIDETQPDEQTDETPIEPEDKTVVPEDESEVAEPEPDEPEKEESDEETTEETSEEKHEEGKRSLDPETQEKVNRRIARITAKAKATQEELQAKLEAAEAKLKNQPASDDGGKSPLAEVVDADGLKKIQAEAEEAVNIADTLLANLEAKPTEVEAYLKQYGIRCEDDGAGNYSVESMRSNLHGISRKANRSLREIPRRENFLAAQDANLKKAFEAMPELKDEHSDEREAFDTFANNFSGIKSSKDWPQAALAYVRGTLSKPAKKIPPKPGKSAGKPRVAPSGNRTSATDTSGRSTDWDALTGGDKDERLGLIQSYLDK